MKMLFPILLRLKQLVVSIASPLVFCVALFLLLAMAGGFVFAVWQWARRATRFVASPDTDQRTWTEALRVPVHDSGDATTADTAAAEAYRRLQLAEAPAGQPENAERLSAQEVRDLASWTGLHPLLPLPPAPLPGAPSPTPAPFTAAAALHAYLGRGGS